MYSPSGHPRCRWVFLFIRTDLEKCSIISLAHYWIFCSEWVPSEYKQLIKTSQVIQTSPVHQLTIIGWILLDRVDKNILYTQCNSRNQCFLNTNSDLSLQHRSSRVCVHCSGFQCFHPALWLFYRSTSCTLSTSSIWVWGSNHHCPAHNHPCRWVCSTRDPSFLMLLFMQRDSGNHCG